jgi:hypothetical protein
LQLGQPLGSIALEHRQDFLDDPGVALTGELPQFLGEGPDWL